MMRPPVSAADLLRAFAAVRPKTGEEKRAVARMLGFDWRLHAAVSDAPKIRKADRKVSARPPPAPAPALPVMPVAPSPSGETVPAAGFRISGPRTAPPPRLEWLRSGSVLPDQPMGQARKPAPLFHPQWTRAILGASLSARSLMGPPDLDRAIDMIARGEAMKMLPRQPIMTLARGVQVLLDIGESMQPFAQDHAALQRDLKRIVGDGTLEVLQFAGSPLKMRRDGNTRGWRDYQSNFLPQLGACVLFVSDFGIGQPPGLRHGASPSTWLALARRLSRRGHRVVGFVPYPKARWPTSLGRAIDFVPWDRSTTVGRIRFSRHRSLVS